MHFYYLLINYSKFLLNSMFRQFLILIQNFLFVELLADSIMLLTIFQFISIPNNIYKGNRKFGLDIYYFQGFSLKLNYQLFPKPTSQLQRTFFTLKTNKQVTMKLQCFYGLPFQNISHSANNFLYLSL